MNELFNPNFPADFLTEYLENGPSYGIARFKTYTIFRFLSAFAKKNNCLLKNLHEKLPYEITAAGFSDIVSYLEEDCYFNPSFAENSADPALLYYAIQIVKNPSDICDAFLQQLFSQQCPAVLATCFDNPNCDFSFLEQDALSFWAALYVCLNDYEAILPEILIKFSEIYWEELQFTCADFVLYDFADEYFQIKDCLHKKDFIELIDTLMLATLRSFNTDLERFTMDVLFQLKHPASRFAGIYNFGALDIKDLPTLDHATAMMKRTLFYAAAYELRNNLYDYHLDEDKTITLSNWKENLKWHYVQYTNVYNHALSSFYSSILSRKILQKMYEENVSVFL